MASFNRGQALLWAVLAGALLTSIAAAQTSSQRAKPVVHGRHLPSQRGAPPHRVGVRYLTSGHVEKPYANSRNIYADILVEQATPYSEGWSFPSGTFDPSCGSLAWSTSGGPTKSTITFSPAKTSLTGSSTLTIAPTSQTPYGVTTLQITATCTSTPTTGASAGGESQTVGVFEYPPDPTASASQQNMTVAAGATGYFNLADAAGSGFGALTWQAWDAPGTTSFANVTTTVVPQTNVLAVTVAPSTSPANYAFYADVYSNTSYGESSPVTLNVTVTAPTPAATPNPLFKTVLSTLKSKTSIPIVLPTVVVFNTTTLGPLYADLDSVSGTGYSIDFDTAPGCNGAGVCIAGYMSSFPASGSINTSTFASTQTVTLQNGLTAIAAIPQYRVPTLITWDANGRRYVIALAVPNFPQDLVTMANSMTAN